MPAAPEAINHMGTAPGRRVRQTRPAPGLIGKAEDEVSPARVSRIRRTYALDATWLPGDE